MLPIFRIVPVGGVLLAILILVLALTPPDRSHLALPSGVVTARGPLIDRREHPEWRQFLILAALRRADELNRLRDLPDTPVRAAPVLPDIVIRIEPAKPTPEAAAPAASEPVSGDTAKPDTAELDNAQSADAQPENDPPETAPAPADRNEDAPKLFAGLPADTRPDDVTGSIDESPGATIPIDIGETSSTELPVVLPEERPPVIRTPERMKPAHESRRKHVRRVRHAKVTPPPPAPLNFFELLFGRINTQPPQPPQAPAAARKSAQRTTRAVKPAAQTRAAAN
jgi:hypothetical protein